MAHRTFVGFGFGAIQTGLFLYEAYRSGNFSRLVVAEVVPDVVRAVRGNGGRYWLNVATRNGIEAHEIHGVEIYNPSDGEDRARIVAAVGDAAEIATALPSVNFYTTGDRSCVADILAEGVSMPGSRRPGRRTIVYTAENHNHAAEILEDRLRERLSDPASALEPVHILNTVIGKMSGVVTDEKQIAEQHLARFVPGESRCYLVEEFNRILITAIRWPDFDRGIKVFEERPDLLPFEEAKLYGHNATHALLGYLARLKGMAYIAQANDDRQLMGLAREAFLEESGKVLCRRHKGVDELFTEKGYRAYAEDLLERMVNPHLRDAVERVVRDPRRKLGWDDRLVGTLRVALSEGIAPSRFAMGAAAAVRMIQESDGGRAEDILTDIWSAAKATDAERRNILDLILSAAKRI